MSKNEYTVNYCYCCCYHYYYVDVNINQSVASANLFSQHHMEKTDHIPPSKGYYEQVLNSNVVSVVVCDDGDTFADLLHQHDDDGDDMLFNIVKILPLKDPYFTHMLNFRLLNNCHFQNIAFCILFTADKLLKSSWNAWLTLYVNKALTFRSLFFVLFCYICRFCPTLHIAVCDHWKLFSKC